MSDLTPVTAGVRRAGPRRAARAVVRVGVGALLLAIAIGATLALIQIPWSQAFSVMASTDAGRAAPHPAGSEAPNGVAHGEEVGAHNTGVRDEGSLEPSESVRTTHDGQVIEHLEITGALVISHDDVVVRNVRVLAAGLYGVWHPHEDPGENTLIEDVEIVGVAGQRSAGVSPYGSWTLRRARVRGFVDAVKVGSHQRIEESWLEDAYYRPPESHNDAIQSVGGSDVEIIRSRVEGPWRAQTSALILSAHAAPLTDYRILDNLISGGNYSLYLGAKQDASGQYLQPHPENILIRGNVFVENSWQYGLASFDEHAQVAWKNNVFHNGGAIE